MAEGYMQDRMMDALRSIQLFSVKYLKEKRDKNYKEIIL